MSTIHLNTHINAPIQTCFNLARSIELHLESTAQTEEKVVAGKASGLCELGDSITWEAIHFGVKQRLSVEITRMEAPHFFEDRMIKGAFKMMQHQHIFEEKLDGTLMKDIFTYKAPFGILGKFVEWVFLDAYMKRLLLKRNIMIKEKAESTI